MSTPGKAAVQSASSTGIRDSLRLQSLVIENCVHRIRGLLIAGNYARLLADERAGPITKQQREYLEVIVDNSRRIKGILSVLSQAASLDQNRLEKITVLDLIRESALRASIPVDCTVSGAQTAVCIVGCRERLASGILELLNADCWAGRVSISLATDDAWVVINFAGSTSAMARHLQDEPYMVASSIRTRDEGFNQADEVIQLHGGVLSVEWEGGRVREASIRLPAVPAQGFAQ